MFNLCNLVCCICCCCLTGIAVMLFIIYFYNAVSMYPTITVEKEILGYQYNQEYPMYKREVNYKQEDTYVEDYYSYGEPRNQANEDSILRNKRDNLTSTTTTTKTTTTTTTSNSSKAQQTKAETNTTTPFAKNKKSNIKKGNASMPEIDHGSHDSWEEEIDFKLSQGFVDTIHAEAAKENIKEPLGLCRHNDDIQMPEMNITLFPLEQAQEIISCINDLLKNQSKKHLCIELNEEMNAFLKWMLLTGESKERRKQLKITAYQDDFLFPSTCGAITIQNNVFSQIPIGLQPGEMPKSPEEPSPQEPSPQEPSPQEPVAPGVPIESEILTTCAPVNQGKATKSGGLFGRKSKKQ